jgi:NitT/TauT family transport system substrate-binding protein
MNAFDRRQGDNGTRGQGDKRRPPTDHLVPLSPCHLVLRLCALAFILVLSTPCLAAEKVTIALNWVPEPEFGGIYQAKIDGTYAKNGLDVQIKPGGAGAPTWQRVASGQVEFGVASADEVVIARSNGADVVAFYTTYQTCPQGIMVHASRGLKSIEQVFTSGGTLALEIGLPYGKFLEKKYGLGKVKRVPYTGGIANFLADQNFSQQCFIFSEPLAAKQAGADPQTFLVADAGYNPYTGVVITSGDYLKQHPQQVKAMYESLRDGWTSYARDPKPANQAMGELNKTMDQPTFAAAAEAQKALLESDDTKKSGMGVMTLERWKTLVQQLADLKVIDKPVPAEECFSAAGK